MALYGDLVQALYGDLVQALYGDLVQALYGDLVQPAIFFNYFLYHVQYYGLSIYRGYMWYNCTHSTTITMLRIRSDLHPRTIPHTSPVRASYGVSFVSWVILRKMTVIYRERTVCPKTSDRVSVMFLTDTHHAPQNLISRCWCGTIVHCIINTLRPRQNCCLFAGDIFKRIVVNENIWISIAISLKFVPKVRIINIPALVQTMAWRRSGDKPLSEPMMFSLLTHIWVTRPQWVKKIKDRVREKWKCRIQLKNYFRDENKINWNASLDCSIYQKLISIYICMIKINYSAFCRTYTSAYS